MKKKFLLTALLFPVIINAQPFIDLIALQYNQSQILKKEITEGRGKNYQSYSAIFSLPLKVDSDYIVPSPSVDYIVTPFGHFVNCSFSTSWQHQWKNKKWKTAFVFIPRYIGETTQKFKSNHLQFGGAILNTYQKKENLKFKFGAYYNSEFFGPFFLPLLGIDWNVNPKLNVFGVLPAGMTIEYKAAPKKFHTGIMFRTITNSYDLNFTSSFVRINDNQLKLFFDFYLPKNCVFSLEAGHSVLRKYKLGEKINNKTVYSDNEIKDGYLFKAAFYARIRTDK